MAKFLKPPSDGWDDCPTPDCGNKVCMWAGLGLCHPCSVQLVGLNEMDWRYKATRAPGGLKWSGVPYAG